MKVLRRIAGWFAAKAFDSKWPDYERRTYVRCDFCRQMRPAHDMTWEGHGPVCIDGPCADARGNEHYDEVA